MEIGRNYLPNIRKRVREMAFEIFSSNFVISMIIPINKDEGRFFADDRERLWENEASEKLPSEDLGECESLIDEQSRICQIFADALKIKLS
jgi:hypothetical protein